MVNGEDAEVHKGDELQREHFHHGVDLEKRVFKVRIFTPVGELPFAGHPTLGTAYVAAKELLKKDVPDLTLDLKAGMIPVTFQMASDGNHCSG